MQCLSTEHRREQSQPIIASPVPQKINKSYERCYIFQRPQVLQYEKCDPQGNVVEMSELVTSDDSDRKRAEPENGYIAGRADSGGTETVELLEADVKQRRSQLGLFVDLIWVGVVGNLADQFSDQAFGLDDTEVSLGGAFLGYIMAFRLVTRIWYDLNNFMNHFYTDDTAQRIFVLFILVLIVIFGNASPSLDLYDGSTINTLLVIYVIIRGCFTVVNVIHGIANPWLLPVTRVETLVTLPILGLWIGCVFVPMPHKITMFFVSMVAEDFAATLRFTRLYRRLSKDFKLATDLEYYLERVSAFYIVVLGSGVFLLITGTPAGSSIARILYDVIPGFIIFFNLYWIYTNGDQSRTYLHATRRSSITRLIWHTLHIPLFGSILVLGVSIKALISVDRNGADDETEVTVKHNARWVTAAVLSEIMLLNFVLPLLHKSLDPPNKLAVGNRMLRVLPRLLVIPVILGATYGERNLTSSCQLWTLGGLSAMVTFWDIYAGWNRDGKLFGSEVQAHREVGSDSVRR